MLAISRPPFDPPSPAMRPGRVTPRRTRSAATAAKSSWASRRPSRRAAACQGAAELAAAADLRDHAGAAAFEPELAQRRVIGRQHRDVEAAIAVRCTGASPVSPGGPACT